MANVFPTYRTNAMVVGPGHLEWNANILPLDDSILFISASSHLSSDLLDKGLCIDASKAAAPLFSPCLLSRKTSSSRFHDWPFCLCLCQQLGLMIMELQWSLFPHTAVAGPPPEFQCPPYLCHWKLTQSSSFHLLSLPSTPFLSHLDLALLHKL